MGKLKEKLLNNLTSEEIDEMMGDSAFQFVEYMAPQLEDDDIDEINESIKTKYSDSDIQDAITKISDGTSHTNKVFELFLKELNEGYLSKMGYE
jgi:hypothetical protein